MLNDARTPGHITSSLMKADNEARLRSVSVTGLPVPHFRGRCTRFPGHTARDAAQIQSYSVNNWHLWSGRPPDPLRRGFCANDLYDARPYAALILTPQVAGKPAFPLPATPYYCSEANIPSRGSTSCAGKCSMPQIGTHLFPKLSRNHGNSSPLGHHQVLSLVARAPRSISIARWTWWRCCRWYVAGMNRRQSSCARQDRHAHEWMTSTDGTLRPVLRATACDCRNIDHLDPALRCTSDVLRRITCGTRWKLTGANRRRRVIR